MRYIAIISLYTIYTAALGVVSIARLLRSKSKRSIHNRIIINGTFHNPNWFHAHVEPICMSGYGEVVLVTDHPLAEVNNLTYACPPRILNRIFTRAGAKFIWTIRMGFNRPADLFIGYHIFPSAITALVASAIHGAKCCYQVTSGELELKGGGFQAENKLLSALGKESNLIERLANKIISKCDLVIVRGSNAKKYILSTGYSNKLEVVTGSVLTDSQFMQDSRSNDIIFVGRLAEYKRPEIFINTIKEVVSKKHDLKVQIAGDGPLRNDLTDLVSKYGLEANVTFLGQVKNVQELMGNSKILVLTSRWEGVSIAMLESMALGVVPIVSNVGDLSDYVINFKTGFIVDTSQPVDYAKYILKVLNDHDLREELSKNSRQAVMQTSDRERLSLRWRKIIEETVI